MSISTLLENKILQEEYKKDNFIIEYSNISANNCLICVSSAAAYGDDRDESILEYLSRGYFGYDWYNFVHKYSIADNYKKVIFIRDLFKTQYFCGINSKINTFEKLLDFLKQETAGYAISVIGCSMGGFTALLLGKLLYADYVFAFSPAIYSFDRLFTDNMPTALLLKNKKYTNLCKILKNENNTKCIIFWSIFSSADALQLNYFNKCSLQNNANFIIKLDSDHHGVVPYKNDIAYILKNTISLMQKIKSDKIFTDKQFHVHLYAE